MRIKGLRISGFRSLKDVILLDLSNLVVIVGPNNSGKTNVLEALAFFFQELTPEFERNLGGVSDYSWYDRDFLQPITFDVQIELDQTELASTFAETKDSLKLPEKAEIRFVRTISGTPNAALWKLEKFEVNDAVLHPSPSPSPITSDQLGKILQNLSQLLKGKFSYLPAARNLTTSYTGLQPRNPIMKAEDLNEMRNLGQSAGREDMRNWSKFEGRVKEVATSIQDIRVLGGDLTIRETSGSSTPISWNGGGYQELLATVNRINKGSSTILGIDEPESHLHPSLARRFFDTLREFSQQQQIFLSTHSPIFVDRAELSNVWMAKKDGGATVFHRLKELQDLREISLELGIRPSDIFSSNTVVFVEGPTDRVFYSTIAKKLGIDFEGNDVVFFPTYGKSSGRYHLRVWTETAKSANIPFFMIYDKGAETDSKELIKAGLLKQNSNFFILRRGDIEDYYPPRLLQNAIEDEFQVKFTPDEQKDFESRLAKEDTAVKTVEDILVKRKGAVPRYWKTAVGKRVADEIRPDEVAEEIRRMLDRIASETGYYS